LKEKALLWMPVKIRRKKKKGPKTQKKKKERTKKKKKSIRMNNQDPPPSLSLTRQDTQAHGKVPQSGDVAQSVVTLAQGSLYATRKMLKLSVEEASVLV
jgi:hypothetical protein